MSAIHDVFSLFQFAQYPSHACRLAMVLPVAAVAGVAVGSRGKASETADGQLLSAAATDEGLHLSQSSIFLSHIAIREFTKTMPDACCHDGRGDS